MKYLFIAATAILLISCEKEDNKSGVVEDSVTMGGDYANDVFYSLGGNPVFEVPRDNWDIGFATYVMSPSIIINSGAGVELYQLSRDTSLWYLQVDTTGLHVWPKLNNSPETWDYGAFSGNMTGGFDFGWGIYDHVTKNVNGAAVYVIRLQDGGLKKIFIRRKNGYQNTFYFLYANTDGSDEQSVALAANPYAFKEYVYYSLTDNVVVDREPSKDDWDLLFTRYFDSRIPYVVIGVLTKPGVRVAKVTGMSPASADTTMVQFSASKSAIGYDWKQYDMTTSQYSLVDDVSYFVKTTSGKVYQIYFTRFEGATTGVIDFTRKSIK
ncbi:MAG TPA: hypothetical protein VJ346_03225 [Bacteroidales bacterium]|nr:hypothetical protein [Bacteroidales bacterium]